MVPQTPPQLVASGLFNSYLVPFFAQWLPIARLCIPSRSSVTVPPTPTIPPPSFLSTSLPVALQISGGRQCQAFQLFKQVSGWCRVPAGVAFTIVVSYIAALCPPPPAVLPMNQLATRELQGPYCTGAQLIGVGFICVL